MAQYIKMADRVIVAGYVFEESTGNPMPYVNVYVKRTRIGTITDPAGYFMLNAKINDTLTLSSLGYDRKYVVLNDSATDNMKPLIVFLDSRIYELNSIDIIALKRYKQLEYEITNMQLKDDDYTYAARNFPFRPADLDYYTRVNAPGFGLVFSPISALYDMFSKEGKERRKLEEIKARDYLNSVIEDKISTSFIMKITGMSQQEANSFIDWCDFSPEFVIKLTEYDLISVIIYKNMHYQKIKTSPKLD
jgi:hypothetical protein